VAINSSGIPPSFVNVATTSDHDRYESEMLGFAHEAIQEGDLLIRGTEGYSKIIPTMQAIMGVLNPTVQTIRPSWASNTAANEVGRLAAIIRAELTDTKPSADFKSFNQQFSQHAINFGRMWTSWYYNEAIDTKYGGTVDYALVAGSGYSHQFWNKFTQDMDVVPYDARDVLPIRPIDNTIQSCYAVILRREMTVNAVRAMFPSRAKDIVEDRPGSTVKLPETSRASLLNSAIAPSPFEKAQMTSQPAEKRGAGIPVVDLYYMYVNDPTFNTSADAKQVGDFRRNGEPANDYSYIVQPRQPLYPRKRLVIFTRKAVLYDGPNIYWHGMFPVSKYTLDPWQWTWLGKTPLWDCLPLQETLNRCLRIMDDHVRKVLRPPVHGDKMTVGEEELRLISEGIAGPGARWRENRSATKGVIIENVPPLDAIIKDLIDLCVHQMASQCGVDQMKSVMDLNQIPEGSTIEKLQFATRPEIRSRSRMLEVFYREQGRMFMYNAAQFYSARRKFSMLGSGSLTPDDYDFDPATFFPSTPDPSKRFDVVDEWLKGFSFYVAPASLLRAAQTTDQMMALTLFRMNAIDVQSLLERLDWPNVQQVLQRLAEQMQIQAAAQQQGAGSSGGSGPLHFGGSPSGQKPSGQQAPHMQGDHMSES
jgi:hypothetical protein